MASAPTEHDKRDYPRLPKEADITLAKLEYPLSTEKEEFGALKNIAKGGIGLIVANAYEPGSRVSLKINLKGWRRYLKSVASIVDDSAGTVATTPLTAIAEVVWTTPLPDGNGHEIGVKFLDIYEDEYNALKKYLETMADYLAR
ncbi:MAG: PilZ domain-containing protein [Candidatus Contendobacter sp.]|nr:PilZ domain-containing protein [Candidatus Contendobacter sp.]MDS4057061.1 PilZ domain-containing protein [Candidatus Contendobacter sp.]